MDKRKFRKYPPMLVVVAVALIIGALGVGSAAQQAGATRTEREPELTPPLAVAYIAQSAKPAPTPEPAPAPEQTPTPIPTPEPTTPPPAPEPAWSEAEGQMLMKIAMAEAEGESTEGKALVMRVVLNRVADRGFPGTIEEVIFQRNQFSPMAPGGRWYTTEPNEDCAEALALVESGWDESQGALFFESVKGDSWHSRNLEFLFEFGGHRFYC